MIGNLVKGRVFVFVDAANILYSQQSLGWRVDYLKLKEYFKNECNLTSIFFYTGQVGDNRKQTVFLHKLKNLGYEIKSKEVKRIKLKDNTYEWKGNLDVEITIDILQNIDNFDSLVLMSGDSDFAAVLDVVKKRGKRVIVMSTKGHISKELLNRAKYVNIKKLESLIKK